MKQHPLINCLSLGGTLFALMLLLFACSAYTVFRTKMAAPELALVNLELLPMQLGPWKGSASQGLSSMARDILQLDHALRRTYRLDDGSAIDLYIGYWKKQNGEHQAAKHSPAVCLPSNGWNTWARGSKNLYLPQTHTTSAKTGTGSLTESSGGRPLPVNHISAELAHQDYFFLYWFFSGDRTYANEWSALFFITLEKFLKNRSDGGIVEISTSVGSAPGAAQSFEKAENRLTEFATLLQPELQRLIGENDQSRQN